MKWNALILAGSRKGVDDPVAAVTGASHKALVKIHDRPMISYVVDALQAVPEIDTITVSIEAAAELPDNLTRIDALNSPASSVLAGIDKLGTPLLITTADNPLINPDAVRSFIKAAEQTETDVAAGVCPRSIVEQANNPARRTYLKFKDGPVSGCNLFAFKTAKARAAADFWRSLEKDRKKPWQMASKVGFGSLLQYLTGQLPRTTAAARLGKAAGCRAELLLVEHPLAAHDVDKPNDLIFAEQCLKKISTE